MPYHSTIGSAGSSLFVRNVRFGSQGHLTLKANLLSRVKAQEGVPTYKKLRDGMVENLTESSDCIAGC